MCFAQISLEVFFPLINTDKLVKILSESFWPFLKKEMDIINKQKRIVTVQGSGLGKRLKLHPKKARKKCGFCHIIAKCYVPGLWVCGSDRFSRTKRLQNGLR